MLRIKSILLFIIFNSNIKLIFAFNLEELKWINYEVDILQTPIKLGEEQSHSVLMTSKYGQNYQCILPQIDEEISEKEVVNEKPTDIKELLKPMQSSSCLLKSKDWWTYEFCFGHYIKQFHIEDGQIVGQVITLGLYESDYNWDNETDLEKFKHVKQRYHSQFYSNGTKCDLTGQPRNAEVRIYCEEDAGDYIYRVDEPGTCSYIITVHTSRLCSHPKLKPLPSNKAHAIACSPILNEEQYEKYLQKLNEEKTLAEEKRNQWLNNQQERLQVMKTWVKDNFPHIDGEEIEKLTESTDEKELEDNILIPKHDEISESQENKFAEFIINNPNEVNKFVNEGDDYVLALEKILHELYNTEIEKLKTELPPEEFASVKNVIKKQLDSILSEAKNGKDSLKNNVENKDKAVNKLDHIFNILLDKLDKAEKDVNKATSELKKAKSALSIPDSEAKDEPKKDEDGNIKNSNAQNEAKDEPKKDEEDGNIKNSNAQNEGHLKVIENEQSQTAVLDDDKLHVRIRRLDRKSSDSSGKLHEMDFTQRKRLEQAVKEKLEKAGLDTGGRRIEVKIITAGYYDNEDGKDFHALSDEETNQFQNMIMALLTGQQEALQEMERQKKLEENYKFIWGTEQHKDDEES